MDHQSGIGQEISDWVQTIIDDMLEELTGIGPEIGEIMRGLGITLEDVFRALGITIEDVVRSLVDELIELLPFVSL